MTPCSYAACHQPATTTLDGWPFCPAHTTLHRTETISGAAPMSATPTRPPRPTPQHQHAPRKTAACGTRSGYQRHQRLQQTPCTSCTQAERAYQAARPRPTGPRQLKPHGTHAAAMRHWDRHEPLCDACRQHERARDQQRYANRHNRQAAA